jgi:antitoxin (DNA-binding transcriptional repressor) of toxin-antitoxin stability system
MKRYSVSMVRQRLADVLDEAASGTPVVIERRGVRYVLRAEARPAPKRPRRPLIEVLDPAVARGEWEWTLTARGLRFRPRRPSKA